MNAKEILAKAKALFSGVEIKPVVPAKFDSWDVDGGQPVYVDTSDDGISDIDLNDNVYLDAGMTMPYPDGSYTIAGTDFAFTCAGGVVTAATGTLTPGAPAAAAPTAPPTMPVTPPPSGPPLQQQISPQLTHLEDQLKELKAQNVKLSSALEVSNTLIQKHEKTIPALFELCEKLTETPAADPKTLTGRKKEVFERMEKSEEKINSIAESLKKIRQNKN
jgi:hypothetical protein